MKRLIIVLLVLLVVFNSVSLAGSEGKKELTRAEKLAWFKEAKFGMFIHWGPYAIPAGYWKGNKNSAEWIQLTANIPNAEYEPMAATFNPVDFDARRWVAIAKDVGMKYITITAKHHDGFSMYDSALTKYDIIDWTPFGRDPMKELA